MPLSVGDKALDGAKRRDRRFRQLRRRQPEHHRLAAHPEVEVDARSRVHPIVELQNRELHRVELADAAQGAQAAAGDRIGHPQALLPSRPGISVQGEDGAVHAPFGDPAAEVALEVAGEHRRRGRGHAPGGIGRWRRRYGQGG